MGVLCFPFLYFSHSVAPFTWLVPLEVSFQCTYSKVVLSLPCTASPLPISNEILLSDIIFVPYVYVYHVLRERSAGRSFNSDLSS